MTVSDVLLIICLALAFVFSASYGIGSPWYRSPLGWVIFSYSLAVVALLGLIVFAVLTGERIAEPVRIIVAGALLVALAAKVVILYVERRAGARLRPPERIKR